MKSAFLLSGFLIVILNLYSPDAFAQEIYQMTVAQDGSGDYTSIQQAIDASKSFPDQRVTIFVKNGTYKEKIVVPSINTRLSIIGESVENTILSNGDSFNKRTQR